jgi:hypothetical protein
MPNWVGPTAAEVEAWASRERNRREQWALGPTPEQAALWAVRERERRTVSRSTENLPAPRGLLRRTLRDFRLAGFGALQLLINTSARDAVEYLVQAGLDWEQETARRREG